MTRARTAALLLAALTLLGAVLRLQGLGSVPLCPDELHYAADAILPLETATLAAVRDLDCLGHRLEDRARHGMLQPLLTRGLHSALALTPTPATQRLLPALAGVLSIPAIFWAGKVLWSARQGLLAAALLATLPWHVRFSRTAYLDSLFTLWILGAVASAATAWRLGWISLAILAGLCVGLALATKVSAPILVLWLLVAAAHRWRDLAHRPRHALRLMVPGAVTAGILWLLLCDPAAYWAAAGQPDRARYGGLGVGELLLNAFRQLPWVAQVVSGAAPGLILAAPVAVAAMLRGLRAGDAPALLLAFLWLPLGALHAPPLSGEHGWLPLLGALCLLAGRAGDLAHRRSARLLLVTGLALNALLAVPVGMWFIRVPWAAHFRAARSEMGLWRALWSACAATGPSGPVLTGAVPDLVSVRNFLLFRPAPLLALTDPLGSPPSTSDLPWCAAVVVSQGDGEPPDAWRILRRPDPPRPLVLADFAAVERGDWVILRPRVPFMLVAADLTGLRGGERVPLFPERAEQGVFRFRPWRGWKEELAFELSPPSPMLVYSAALYLRGGLEGLLWEELAGEQ